MWMSPLVMLVQSFGLCLAGAVAGTVAAIRLAAASSAAMRFIGTPPAVATTAPLAAASLGREL